MLPECSTNFMNPLNQFIILPIDLTCGTSHFHDSGPLPKATSWIFQTNFIHLFTLHGFVISLLASSIRVVCLPVCFVFTLKHVALTSNFLWSFITITQTRKQVVPVLLWSLITTHRSKQHIPNVVGVVNPVDLKVQCGCGFDCEEC